MYAQQDGHQRYEVCKALSFGYKNVLQVIQVLSEDNTQQPSTRHEAIKKKTRKTRICFYVKNVDTNIE